MVWTIIAIILFFTSYFTVNFINADLGFLSSIFVVLFAVPSLYYLYKESNNAIKIILSISILAYVVETIGILTGFPYSPFNYTDLIGYKIMGVTPLTLPFAFLPLVLGAMHFALKQKTYYKKVIVGVLIILLTDIILDPGAVALNLWVWQINGVYYGVPFINFLGWIFTGTIATLIFLKLHNKKLSKNLLISMYLTVSFWTGVCMWLKLIIPFLIGLVFTIYLTIYFNKK